MSTELLRLRECISAKQARISRSNEIMDDTFLRKSIWHCVLFHANRIIFGWIWKRPPHVIIWLSFFHNWDMIIILCVGFWNAFGISSISRIWNYGRYEPSGKNLIWFHDFMGTVSLRIYNLYGCVERWSKSFRIWRLSHRTIWSVFIVYWTIFGMFDTP
jgi:hypothetical protein